MLQRRFFLILADLIMIALVTVLPHVAGLPMVLYPPVVLLVLWLYLKWKKLTYSDIGFRWRDFSWKSFIIGCALGIAWATVIYFLVGPLIVFLTGLSRADLSDFESIRHNRTEFFLLLAVAWLLVVPYEEIVFRGFVLTTLRRLFNDRFWLAALVQSVLFAVYHWQEGESAMITIFIGAIFTVWLYKVFRGNLWYLIFFHAAYDTVMLSLFRSGYL